MGVNNRKRRAAKQRKRTRQRPPINGGGASPHHHSHQSDEQSNHQHDEAAELAEADHVMTSLAQRIGSRRLEETELMSFAASITARLPRTPMHVISAVMIGLVARLTDAVTAGGWGPADLVELVRRRGDGQHVPVMLAALYDESRRNQQRTAAWLAALEGLGPDRRLRFDTIAQRAAGLRVAGLLAVVPPLDTTTLGDEPDAGPAHPKLARVRALLAKAESTNFDEEAEALTAKAQELISRYALGRLLEDRPGRGHGGTDAMSMRRIWLDTPYVGAKASLVAQVARANRCQAAVAESLGFSLVVGDRYDLDAVELLVTSLLVQADQAMLRHGRQSDSWGTSRTRSFRQSFLLAYAGRIGERLREANESITAEDTDRYLPVLRDQEKRVAEAFDAMVPHTTARARSISNHAGWVAGLAAADLAKLDVRAGIKERAV